jgi:hypothetical protein
MSRTARANHRTSISSANTSRLSASSGGPSLVGMGIEPKSKEKAKRRMSYALESHADKPDFNADHEALKMGLLLSQQEAEYG